MLLKTCAAVAILALMTAPVVQAQDKTVTLKMSTWVPPQHPFNPAAIAWAADIEKESGGTIKAILFPSEQLGKAFDHYDMVRDGIADVVYANPGYQPGRFPIVSAIELPFLIANGKGGSAAADEWYRQYAAKEMPDVHYCFTFVLDPSTFHVKRKITMPEDVKGMKIRPSDATVGAFVNLLGGTNVQASAPEAREVLERGVADGIVFPWGSFLLFGMDKVVKFHIDEPIASSMGSWLINKSKYEALSPAQKTVIDNHCTAEWSEKFVSPWADFEHGGRDRVAALPGQEVYHLTPDQLAAWKKSAEPVTAKWAAAVPNGAAVLDDLKAALKRHEALAQ
jgi:TRAP-type C4-dicarboxylate transport system substrate-binding protein